MLILTRRAGESFTIGENITVTVTDVRGGQARIGIDAPKEINIQRDDMVNKNPPVSAVG